MAQTKSQERKQKKEARNERVKQLIKQEEEGAMIFQKQSAFGFKFNTDGFNVFYEHGKYKTITKTSLWWVDLGERKDPKQYKQSNLLGVSGSPIVVQGNGYIYGKQNNLYYLRFGLGQQKVIGGKGNKNGVAVSAIYGGGLTLGMLKPYYVQIQENGQAKDIKYDNNDNVFLDPNVIIGGSAFGKGFSEMKYVPGAHVRGALRFDYGHYNETITAIEVGVNAEYFSQAMPVMVGVNTDKKFFFNAYVALLFGRRK